MNNKEKFIKAVKNVLSDYDVDMYEFAAYQMKETIDFIVELQKTFHDLDKELQEE